MATSSFLVEVDMEAVREIGLAGLGSYKSFGLAGLRNRRREPDTNFVPVQIVGSFAWVCEGLPGQLVVEGNLMPGFQCSSY